MFFKRPLTLLVLAATLFGVVAGISFAQDFRLHSRLQLTEEEMESIGLYECSLTKLDLPFVRTGQAFSVDVTLDEEEVTLDLLPYSMRSPIFRVRAQGEGGRLREVVPPPPMTFRGRVRGHAGSEVAASFVGGKFHAMILVRPVDSELWFVQPYSSERIRGDYHVVYNNLQTIVDSRWTDGHRFVPGQEPPENGMEESTGGEAPPIPLGPPTGYEYETEIAFQTDYEFYDKNGSSMSQTIEDLENVLNGVDLVYKRDVSICYKITEIIVQTTSGAPYPSTMKNAEDILDTFQADWKNNHADIQRDIAHMMCGRNFIGSTIGLAWVSVVCDGVNGRGYAIVATKFSANYKNRVALSSHEIGHNYGCGGHCDGGPACHIMCSVLGGCIGIGKPNFGGWAKSKITTYADIQTCMDLVPATSIMAIDASIGQNELVVEVSPPDMWGEGDGVVPFTREYDQSVEVTLTAPLEYYLGSFLMRFINWELDEVPQPNNQNEVSFTADFVQALASYNYARYFTLTSTPVSGVPITLDPPDIEGVSNGLTPFTTLYFLYQNVTLTAPLNHGPYLKFYRWKVNGDMQPVGQNVVSFLVQLFGGSGAKAYYVLLPFPSGIIHNQDASPSVQARG